eukprot:COSAG03_NODE_18164_length_360_cov_1.379310_1_plen_88_part_01
MLSSLQAYSARVPRYAGTPVLVPPGTVRLVRAVRIIITCHALGPLGRYLVAAIYLDIHGRRGGLPPATANLAPGRRTQPCLGSLLPAL